ncbi:MAG: response regulator [Nanoarchaeota archaeon]
MKKKVLIIEDDPNIAEAERLILEKEFEVFMAHDGSAGLSLCKEIMPDLIILDLMLPKLSGFEVCKMLRDEGFDKKIVMVTAKTEPRNEIFGMDLGADDYIMKPFEPQELLHVVHQVLKR